jgi:hypothetical protein
MIFTSVDLPAPFSPTRAWMHRGRLVGRERGGLGDVGHRRLFRMVRDLDAAGNGAS